MTFLDDSLLDEIRSRAPGYDRDNTFFTEDLDALRAAGYLAAHVPTDLGGAGLSLLELVHEQSRLAGAAPATALAVNMHQVWCGVGRVLHDRGDDGLDVLLREAAAGELFAFGISERGNDLVLFGSATEARPDGEGGYRFHGTKIFTSLAPAWTRLGVHGLDASDPDDPRIVYGFVTREGTETKDDWDTLGMRATQSRTTVLDGAHAPADRVVRRLPPGPNPDPFVFGIFACFELLLSSVYLGIAQRALDLAVETVRSRTSMKTGDVYAHDPDIRWRLATAAMDLETALTQLHATAADVDAQVDHGPRWFAKLAGTKVRATETAKDVVEAAIRVSGGGSYFTRNELSRLYRDVLAGLFHPSDDESAHATVATALLGPLP
ncbi:MAG TPA: acyl-CoA dehydrogenase family protein [Actinotalea caeni]|uniref:acyl-CoA dehydrogenase family protein n=1 Tax=Actinotalea caeni TaxID=1348467 RepID=UPI002B4B3E16|nr:acyl-CoA dehydrogenase family protein [Actinotalea caeni]HLV54764.1 acyl-CoA dehydrogenase family protein [Actinotalea caeni]